MLTVSALNVSISGSQILRGVNFTVPAKSVFCLMGRNGVGKTTTLKSIVGLQSADSGSITFDGAAITKQRPEFRARAGMGYVPQGRDIFPHLTVEENLDIGMRAQGKTAGKREKLDRVFSLFPILKEFLPRKGGMLSGGQQQQLAIARALLTEPKLLVLDEPTEGIQPNIIDQIGDAIRLLRNGGHPRETEILAGAAHSLKKLQDEVVHPAKALIEKTQDLVNLLRKHGVEKNQGAYEEVSTAVKTLHKEGPREGAIVAEEIGAALKLLRSEGQMSILLVEQYLDFCKGLADVFAIMDRGAVVASGTIAELTDDVVKKHLTV
jgi:urea transport system ATP-binding protein